MANTVNQANTRTASARATAKKRRNQLPFAILLLIGIIIFGFVLNGIGVKLPIYWIFGISFGIVLQKS
ncbi:MAG TPA: transporter, partial [Firmicutes bacterium]|nr:transporter [Bacillota bacterium]